MPVLILDDGTSETVEVDFRATALGLAASRGKAEGGHFLGVAD
jgi:hypothetical protein